MVTLHRYDLSALNHDEILSWKLSEHVTSPARSPRTKHSITSCVEDKKINLTNYEKKNSSGDLQPQKKCVQAFHTYKLKIFLKNVIWYIIPPKFNFRFHQSR